MKGFSWFKYISMVVGLFLGTQVFAQPDLSVSSFGSPYQFNGDGQSNTIQLQISNNGDQDTMGGVTLNFTPDMLVDPSFQFLDTVVGSDWNCPNFSTTKSCQYIGEMTQGSFSILDISVIVQAGNFDFAPAFSVNVIDNNGDETNFADNTESVDIEYSAGGSTDFTLSVSPTGNPVTLPAGGGTRQLTYTVTNDINGVPEGDQTTVTFNLNFLIEPANVTPSDPNWDCSSVTSQIICNYNGVYATGYSSDLILSITSPTNPTTITNALDVDVTNALGDSNPSNDHIVTDIDFVSGGGIDLEIVKSITAGFSSTVAPGGPISFDLNVTNLSSVDATNVLVMDDLLVNNLLFDSSGSSPECTEVSSTVQCSLSLLAAGNTFVFTIASNVSNSAALNNYINTATVSATEVDFSTSNNSSDQAFTVAVVGTPEIAVSKTIDGNLSQVVQGAVFDYIIEVNNTGTANATNVDLIDALPSEVTYQSHTDLGPNFTCSYSASVVTCNASSLPNTTSQDGVRITVVANGPINASVNNTASSSFADGNSLNNSSTATMTIIAPTADLDLSMTADSSFYFVGDAVNLDLILHNPFASTGEPIDAVVTATLPNEVVFDSAQVTNASGWSCIHDGSASGGDVVCDSQGTPVDIGTNTNILITGLANTVGTSLSATANVISGFDPNPSNDSAFTGFDISPADADLSIQFSSVSGIYNQGDTIVHTIQVDNPMGSTANPTDVTINIALPVEVSFTNTNLAGAPGWVCNHDGSPSGGVIICDRQGAPFVSFTTHNLSFEVLAVSAATNALFQASVNSTADSNTANNVTNMSDVVNAAVSDFSIVKTVSGTDFAIGDSFTYYLDVSNSSASSTAPSDVTINDQLPPEVSFDSYVVASNLGTAVNCIHDGSAFGGLLSCDTSSGLFAVGEVVTIDVNVTAASANNNVINTATVQTVTDSDGVTGNNSGAAPAVTINNSTVITTDYGLLMVSSSPDAQTGEQFTHTMFMNNRGAFPINTINASLLIPSQAQLIDVQSAEMNCSTSNNFVTCTNTQALAPDDSLSIDILMQSVDFIGLLTSQVDVTADGLNKSVNTSIQINEPVNSFANDMAIIKTANTEQIMKNGRFSYLFDVINLGSESQSGFTLTDSLPQGVEFDSYEGVDWVCSGVTNINCQYNASLDTGGSSQLIFNVVAPNQTGTLVNSASLNLESDENLINNQSSVSVAVIEGLGLYTADLAVELTADSNEVLNSEQVNWLIEVTNYGPNNASNVKLENQFPIGFNADSVQVADGANCVLLNSSLVCDIDVLAVNQSLQIKLTGGFNNAFSGPLLNVIEVSSDEVDPDVSNNQSQAQINVIDVELLEVDLQLELITQAQNIQQGDVFDVTLKTNNLGPDQARDAVINGSFSGIISDVQVINSGQWLCQASNTNLTCQFPTNYVVGSMQNIELKVMTQQVVQQSQAIVFNASIESPSVDVNPGNNLVGLTNEVSRTPTEDEIFSVFEDAVGSGASATVMRTIRNVSSYCARKYFMAIEGLCEEMIASARPENRDSIINAMEEITPNEVIGQSTSASEMITSQFKNIDSRLSELRGGGGAGVSVAGLTGRYGNESIPLGMLAYLNQSDDESSGSAVNDFISPWGFFVNGNISMGERDATGRELGFDFDTYGLTAGVDYRLSPSKVVGMALGYANFDSEIEDEAEMKSTGFTLTGYGSFYIKDNFYMDARISYGNPDFEQTRRIKFDLDNIAIDRVATGKTDANQYSVAMSLGYHFNKNAWNITPNASVRYVRTTIDAFQETGAGGFNFAFGEQQVKSMVWSVGTSVSKAISLKNGVISPQFDFNLSRETENDGGLLEARFITAPVDEIFYIETDEPDRTYGSAGVGLVFIGANGKQAYINYRSIFGLEGFTRGTINFGARFEF